MVLYQARQCRSSKRPPYPKRSKVGCLPLSGVCMAVTPPRLADTTSRCGLFGVAPEVCIQPLTQYPILDSSRMAHCSRDQYGRKKSRFSCASCWSTLAGHSLISIRQGTYRKIKIHTKTAFNNVDQDNVYDAIISKLCWYVTRCTVTSYSQLLSRMTDRCYP